MSEHMSLEEYRSRENTKFPLLIGEGTLHSIDLVSDCCDAAVIDIRIDTKMLTRDAAQLIIGGTCSECGAYESGKLRWYLEGQNIQEFSTTEGIREINLTPKGMSNKLKNLFNKLKIFLTTYLNR